MRSYQSAYFVFTLANPPSPRYSTHHLWQSREEQRKQSERALVSVYSTYARRSSSMTQSQSTPPTSRTTHSRKQKHSSHPSTRQSTRQQSEGSSNPTPLTERNQDCSSGCEKQRKSKTSSAQKRKNLGPDNSVIYQYENRVYRSGVDR